MPPLTTYSSDLDYGYAPGLFPTMECLLHRSDKVRRVLISEKLQGEGLEKLTATCAEKHIRTEIADKALKRISAKENCFAAAVFEKFDDPLIKENSHVVLHNAGDCGNVGTILRTALAFGIEDVALIRPCVDVFDPRTVRASMGSLFRLRVHTFDTFEQYQALYPDRQLYPFMLDASLPLQQVLTDGIKKPCSLIFGNEGSGLPKDFSALGQPVRIESGDKVDSLNLSIAAAIAIYGFTR